jgi:hypothetical protein
MEDRTEITSKSMALRIEVYALTPSHDSTSLILCHFRLQNLATQSSAPPEPPSSPQDEILNVSEY